MKPKFYITTSIFYASAKPHIGNTYEGVLTDAIARYKRLMGFDVRFHTGCDEHGEKVESKALAANKSPQEYVDEISLEVKRIDDLLNISYDKFVRTTDLNHKEVVAKIFKKLYDFVFIVPMGYFGDLSKFSYSAYSQVYLDVDDDVSFREALESKAEEYDISYYYYNYSEEQKQTKSLLLALKILIYGFVVLVTSIGVTSVFNTISTSMNLRKSEFAMLRSMGLTRHGFNKMLLCESLFFGLKSLLYALPVSFAIVLYLNDVSKSIVNFNETIIPWNSIIIAIIGVFVIVLISVMYSTRKIKKENILEAIREENI